jgi:hypothetical protein
MTRVPSSCESVPRRTLNDLGKIFHGEDVEARDNAAMIAAGWQLLERIMKLIRILRMA